jgi:leucine dehydrogenase
VAVFHHHAFHHHKQVVFGYDEATGLRAIVGVHSLFEGKSLGGCRMYPYTSEKDALEDVLRLSEGMTYKSAILNLPLGGAKAVIIGDPKKDKSPDFFRALGRFVNDLGGRYITAEDVGTTVEDMGYINETTDYVVGTPNGCGNPSPFTAEGTFYGIQETVKHYMNKDHLDGVTVAMQGLGSVGMVLARHLHEAGAKIVATDISQKSCDYAKKEFGATIVDLDDIYAEKADIFAPCALGATINRDTLKAIAAPIIAGCANNQLQQEEDGDFAHQLGKIYAPDYVINAGGLIRVTLPDDMSGQNITKQLGQIKTSLSDIYKTADEKNIPHHRAALDLAKERAMIRKKQSALKTVA